MTSGWELLRSRKLCKTFLGPQCSAPPIKPIHPGELQEAKSLNSYAQIFTADCNRSSEKASMHADQGESLSRCFSVVWIFFSPQVLFVCFFKSFSPIFWILPLLFAKASSSVLAKSELLLCDHFPCSSCSLPHLLFTLLLQGGFSTKLLVASGSVLTGKLLKEKKNLSDWSP